MHLENLQSQKILILSSVQNDKLKKVTRIYLLLDYLKRSDI